VSKWLQTEPHPRRRHSLIANKDYECDYKKARLELSVVRAKFHEQSTETQNTTDH
jgi:hypothetical protein